MTKNLVALFVEIFTKFQVTLLQSELRNESELRGPSNGKNWTFMRTLKHSSPSLTYLKDLLPHAEALVVFQNTLLPIHTVVADRLMGGGRRELLIQFSESNYENSAWILEKIVPKS